MYQPPPAAAEKHRVKTRRVGTAHLQDRQLPIGGDMDNGL